MNGAVKTLIDSWAEFEDVHRAAWVVQLGSFSSEKNARDLNDRLRASGFASFVEPLKQEDSMAYRVRIGPELRRSDAIAVRDKLKKSLDIDGIVLQYP